MYQVANGSRLSLVVLDAYRNNPFAAKMQRSVRARSVDLGLVCVEPSNNVLSPRRERGTVASDAMVNTAHSGRRCSTTRRQRVGDQLPFPECATRSSRRPSANSNPSFTGRFETDDLSERAYGESTRCGAIEPASSNRDRASSAVDATTCKRSWRISSNAEATVRPDGRPLVGSSPIPKAACPFEGITKQRKAKSKNARKPRQLPTFLQNRIISSRSINWCGILHGRPVGVPKLYRSDMSAMTETGRCTTNMVVPQNVGVVPH
jgi:hypothetical protein